MMMMMMLRGLFSFAKNFYFVVALFCAFFLLATSKRCPLYEVQSQLAGENTEKVKSGFSEKNSTPHLEIKPSLLDWGQKNVYYPSFEFITVKNTDNDNVLSIYDPYSSNSQFYPCNSSEILLAPGEIASICLVFSPTELGLSLSQLVLQTSFGGFLMKARGFALESPYLIKPLSGLDVKNLSLFNPFNEALNVKEMASWISVFSGNTSRWLNSICTIHSIEDFTEHSMLSTKKWLNFTQIAIIPHNWEIGPRKTEAIMELDVSDHFEGKIVGFFCLQLVRSSEKKIETVIVPIEEDLNQNSDKGHVSASLEAQAINNVDYISMQAPSDIKELDTREADESVLKSWESQATASFVSVLDRNELQFATTPIGNHRSQWISVKNPTQEPIIVQLILNSDEIIGNCKKNEILHLQPSSLAGNKSIARTRYGFSIPKHALTEAFIHPYSSAFFGPILFRPSNRCEFTSSALIRNNLSGVEWLSLHGFGGLFSLVLLDVSKSNPVQSLEFKLNLHSTEKNSPFFCSHPLIKEIYAKNTGDFPLEVIRVEVSGSECGLDGFLVRNCKGFFLAPGESILLQISYQSDFFTSATIQRDLELALASGVIVIPMKANLPIYLLNFCKRSIFWMRLKKAMFMILFIASLLFLLVRLLEIGKNSLNSPSTHLNGGGNGNQKQKTDNPSKTPLISSNPDLKVSINKEKKRRRRKKKSSCMGILEVSSSQSGNSTPSSPLSPFESITPKQTFAQAPNEQFDKSRAVLLPPSETFPRVGTGFTNPCCRFLASTSRIAPHARAPGMKVRGRGNDGLGGEMGVEKNSFTYDIWGDHLSGVSLSCCSEEGKSVLSIGNNSESFFVRDPLSLVGKHSDEICKSSFGECSK